MAFPSRPSRADDEGGYAGSGDAVGTIFGDVTTHSFRFTVEDPQISATTYVTVEHESEAVLAQVLKVEREAHATGDRLVAHARIIGKRKAQGGVALPPTPPRSGAPVHRASADLVRDALNLNEKGCYIGHLRGLGVPVHLDVNTLVQKHCSILAKTGAGKSYALGVVLEELLKHRVPVVVIDPHGEHASLAAPNASENDLPAMRRFKVRPRSYAQQVVEYVVDTKAVPDGKPFRLDGRNLSAREISELLGDLPAAQVGVLHQAVRQLKGKGDYVLDDIVAAVETVEGATKWPVLHALEGLVDLGVFSSEPTAVTDLVAEGRATILNLKGAPPHLQEMVVARVARDLFEARKVGHVAPHLFVLEEAHNFCPERNLAKAASGDVVRTIASEGRKFGMGLCVVSQRPAKVDKNVLSQCNTQIILKVTNPNDLKAIASSVEGLPAGIEDEIQALPVGVALVSEPTIPVPLFCEVRPRETRHGGSSVDVVRPEEEVDERATESATPALSRKPKRATPAVPAPAATPEEAMLTDAERAEEAISKASLAKLDPGRLESVLVELEGLRTALQALHAKDTADQARIAGLEARLDTHTRRVRSLLRGK